VDTNDDIVRNLLLLAREGGTSVIPPAAEPLSSRKRKFVEGMGDQNLMFKRLRGQATEDRNPGNMTAAHPTEPGSIFPPSEGGLHVSAALFCKLVMPYLCHTHFEAVRDYIGMCISKGDMDPSKEEMYEHFVPGHLRWDNLSDEQKKAWNLFCEAITTAFVRMNLR
jgi:hypothetical protein